MEVGAPQGAAGRGNPGAGVVTEQTVTQPARPAFSGSGDTGG